MWSQLWDKPAGYLAQTYVRLNKLGYHNEQHLLDCYKYLEDAKVPYDINLDCAILYHDCVYDAEPNKEFRSIDKFIQAAMFDFPDWFVGIDINAVAGLIVDTIEHRVDRNNPLSTWMIQADLSGFMNGSTTLMNYIRVMNESMQLYGCTREDFAKSNRKFIQTLMQRLEYNALNDTENLETWKRIAKGMVDTIHLSNMIDP